MTTPSAWRRGESSRSNGSPPLRRGRPRAVRRDGLVILLAVGTKPSRVAVRPREGRAPRAPRDARSEWPAPGPRVLLVEADLRRPRIWDQLGLDGSDARGLADAIADDRLTLPDVVRHLPRFNLSVLPAGRSPASPYEALHSSRLDELLEEA